MKKFIKMFSFALAFCFMFVITGCNESTDNTTNLTTSQVISLVSGLIDLEDPNFTVTGSADYDMSRQVSGGAEESQTDSLENIVLKVDGISQYVYVPEDVEEYQFYNWSISKNYESEWSDYSVNSDNQDSNVVEQISAYSSYIEPVIQEAFSNLASFEPSWFSSEKQSSGAYKLTINADLKADLQALQTALIDNGGSTLEVLIDDILAIHYGDDFTIDNLVIAIKANITSTSTVADVLNFINTEFGINLTNTYSTILSLLDAMGEGSGFSMPSLTDNFFTVAGVESDEEFSAMIDYMVTTYLNDTTMTLDSLFESIDEESADTSEMLITIKHIYQSLSSITINDSVINFSITTNAARDEIALITGTVNAEIVLGDTTYSIDANCSLAFSNYDTTEIALPSLSNDNIENICLDYSFDATELTAGTAKVIGNVYLGTWSNDFIHSYTVEGETLTLTYNSTDNTLTLSADAVDRYLAGNSLNFSCETEEGSENENIVNFNYIIET